MSLPGLWEMDQRDKLIISVILRSEGIGDFYLWSCRFSLN